VSHQKELEPMRRLPTFAVAAFVACLGVPLAALPAAVLPGGGHEGLIPPPGNNAQAEAYWSLDRMERARIMRPVVLDPVTREPVPAG
jgi:hypothetical protein